MSGSSCPSGQPVVPTSSALFTAGGGAHQGRGSEPRPPSNTADASHASGQAAAGGRSPRASALAGTCAPHAHTRLPVACRRKRDSRSDSCLSSWARSGSCTPWSPSRGKRGVPRSRESSAPAGASWRSHSTRAWQAGQRAGAQRLVCRLCRHDRFQAPSCCRQRGAPAAHAWRRARQAPASPAAQPAHRCQLATQRAQQRGVPDALAPWRQAHVRRVQHAGRRARLAKQPRNIDGHVVGAGCRNGCAVGCSGGRTSPWLLHIARLQPGADA